LADVSFVLLFAVVLWAIGGPLGVGAVGDGRAVVYGAASACANRCSSLAEFRCWQRQSRDDRSRQNSARKLPLIRAPVFVTLPHHQRMSERQLMHHRFRLRAATVMAAAVAACVMGWGLPLPAAAQSLLQTMTNTRPSAPMITSPLALPLRLNESKSALRGWRADAAETGQSLVQAVASAPAPQSVNPFFKASALSRPVLLSDYQNPARAGRAVRLGEQALVRVHALSKEVSSLRGTTGALRDVVKQQSVAAKRMDTTVWNSEKPGLRDALLAAPALANAKPPASQS
jgi:hypothetical protein